MTVAEVRALPMAEKIRIMEAIWDDMRERFEQSQVPEEVRALLDQRRARVQMGAAKVVDWDAAKSTIGRV